MSVGLEQRDGPAGADEEIITVNVTGPMAAALALTNGEARHLARLLIAAADRLDGLL